MKVQKECSNNKKKIVGADASTVYADSVTDKCPNRLMYVCPLLDRNTQNGITLIALIITIIVLLILAMVSIKLIWEGGIITHARTAVDKYKQAEQNEMEQLNNVFGNNENQNNVPEELQKYVLGDNLAGQPLENICNWQDDWSFPNQLNGESVEVLNLVPYCYTENSEEVWDYAIYIKYKNKAYRILGKYEYVEGQDGNDGTEKITTKSVALIYEPKGDEGKTVEYSIDGTEANKKQWTILYDDGTNYEIISPESVGSLTLGEQDEEATGNNEFEKATDSYNHAIERINKYASDLITNPNKLRVRSVGSNPSKPNSRNTDKYTSEKLGSWNCTYNEYKDGTTTQIPVTINGVGERSDNNYEQDLVRMSFWPGVAGTGEEYWLASRYVESNSDYVYFSVNAVHSDGSFISSNLWNADSNGYASPDSHSYAVRPVVKISK